MKTSVPFKSQMKNPIWKKIHLSEKKSTIRTLSSEKPDNDMNLIKQVQI